MCCQPYFYIIIIIYQVFTCYIFSIDSRYIDVCVECWCGKRSDNEVKVGGWVIVDRAERLRSSYSIFLTPIHPLLFSYESSYFERLFLKKFLNIYFEFSLLLTNSKKAIFAQ